MNRVYEKITILFKENKDFHFMKIIILIFISVFSVKFIIIMHTQGLNQGWCSTISFNSVVYILGNKLQEIGYDHVALRRCK